MQLLACRLGYYAAFNSSTCPQDAGPSGSISTCSSFVSLPVRSYALLPRWPFFPTLTPRPFEYQVKERAGRTHCTQQPPPPPPHPRLDKHKRGRQGGRTRNSLSLLKIGEASPTDKKSNISLQAQRLFSQKKEKPGRNIVSSLTFVELYGNKKYIKLFDTCDNIVCPAPWRHFFSSPRGGGGEEDDSIPPSLGAVVGRRFRARGS